MAVFEQMRGVWHRKEVGSRVTRVWKGRPGRISGVIAAALLGGWLGLSVGAQVTTALGPADVNLSLSPSLNGETVVNVAPLGRLSFDTHASPLRVEVGIEEIRLAAAEEMFNDPAAIDRMAAGLPSDVREGVIRLSARSLGSAVLGAGLAGLVLFRDVRRAGWSALTAGTAVLAAGGVTYLTFNPNAISEPRYTGLLAGAPQVVGSAEEVVERFEEYRQQLAGLLVNVSRLYEVTSALPVFADDDSTIRVLHVADLHLNPAAWNVIRSLEDQFQVDLIIDSGDITDRGSAAEDVYMEDIATLESPYVWVRGNHDSMGTQRAVEAQENAIVLDDDIVDLAGLRIYGAGDPRFTPDHARDNPDYDEVRDIGAAQAASVADVDPPVDIVVMHDPLQAEPFSGQVPLVLAGHGHRRWTETEPTGTQYLVQGSTGGAGLRGLEPGVETPTPIQASVLYFDVESRRLQARDDINLGGLGLTSAQIERHIEEDPDRDIEPVPATPDLPETPEAATPPAVREE